MCDSLATRGDVLLWNVLVGGSHRPLRGLVLESDVVARNWLLGAVEVVVHCFEFGKRLTL